MASIRMTPQELRDSATFLSGKRDEIVSAVNEIKSRVDSTTAEWEGAAQSSFVESFNEMLPMLTESFPETIQGIESMLTGAADALEQADSEVAKAFKG
ncbi:MAG TPA: WXG100 family type VII secretion target [Candidatus Mediterraneibacter excrementipullorum]|nr:WXG100 family type VII secretion target [Candidatus Mediterraneibacter excrementipullorum]